MYIMYSPLKFTAEIWLSYTHTLEGKVWWLHDFSSNIYIKGIRLKITFHKCPTQPISQSSVKHMGRRSKPFHFWFSLSSSFFFTSLQCCIITSWFDCVVVMHVCMSINKHWSFPFIKQEGIHVYKFVYVCMYEKCPSDLSLSHKQNISHLLTYLMPTLSFEWSWKEFISPFFSSSSSSLLPWVHIPSNLVQSSKRNSQHIRWPRNKLATTYWLILFLIPVTHVQSNN